MIEFLIGKPRGGKSLRAVGLLVQEVLRTDRLIVTNLALRMGPLQAYLWKLGYEGNIADRVRILSAEESRRWPLYRGFREGSLVDDKGEPALRPSDAREIRWANGPGGGVCFILDEVHHLHNARRWAETGPWVLWYCTQMGHFCDRVILITQAMLQVDRQLRCLAQVITEFRNLGKETWYGFALPSGRFVWKEYLDYPGPAMNMGTIALNRELGGCYHSRRFNNAVEGEGMSDGDTARGKPIWIAVVVIGCLIAAVSLLPWFLGKAAGGMVLKGAGVGKPVQSTGSVSVASAAAASLVRSAIPGLPAGAPAAASVEPGGSSSAPEPVICARAWIPGKGWYVGLSDGRDFEPGDARVTFNGRLGSIVEGKFLKLGKGSSAPIGPAFSSMYVNGGQE